MAQKVNVLLVDDLDGSDATETIMFGLDGKTYEIDLNDRHAAALRKALTTYVDAARKVSGTQHRRARKSSTSNTKDIRAWAKTQKMEISERGRIPADVQHAYEAAH
jgi:hypothetical protein